MYFCLSPSLIVLSMNIKSAQYNCIPISVIVIPLSLHRSAPGRDLLIWRLQMLCNWTGARPSKTIIQTLLCTKIIWIIFQNNLIYILHCSHWSIMCWRHLYCYKDLIIQWTAIYILCYSHYYVTWIFKYNVHIMLQPLNTLCVGVVSVPYHMVSFFLAGSFSHSDDHICDTIKQEFHTQVQF